MTPAARSQAAIALLDEVIAAAREGGAAADTLIAHYFKERRFAGSHDRREIRALVFGAIRRAGELCPAGGLESDTLTTGAFVSRAQVASVIVTWYVPADTRCTETP